MTTQEFSNTFDTLKLNVQSKEFGQSSNVYRIREYEKSVFLTQAQEELILTYYTGKKLVQRFF